jgi:hypothetical protein
MLRERLRETKVVTMSLATFSRLTAAPHPREDSHCSAVHNRLAGVAA